MLEGCRCVRKAKEDYQGFKKPLSCSEGCFPLVPLRDPKKVIGVSDVQGRVVFSGVQLVQGFLDQWKEVPVLDCSVVESSVVDAQPKGTVLFSYKENWCPYP